MVPESNAGSVILTLTLGGQQTGVGSSQAMQGSEGRVLLKEVGSRRLLLLQQGLLLALQLRIHLILRLHLRFKQLAPLFLGHLGAQRHQVASATQHPRERARETLWTDLRSIAEKDSKHPETVSKSMLGKLLGD